MGHGIGQMLGRGIGPLAGMAATAIPGVGPFIGPVITALSSILPSVFAGSQKAPSLTPPPGGATGAAPIVSPDVQSVAGAGLTGTVPGPGPTNYQGAGTAGQLGQQVATNLFSDQNPFAQYAVT